jgi:hypothetical protein
LTFSKISEALAVQTSGEVAAGAVAADAVFDPQRAAADGGDRLRRVVSLIFFVELRERYVCSWCEMHDGRLILIPSHESKRRAQHVRYPAEATIVGRVTGVSMDLVEPSESEARA